MVRCRAFPRAALVLLCAASISGAARAGIVNPNISALGQVVASRTDDASSENARATTLALGETELVLDSYLNPYAKGFFVFSIGGEGLETEEAFLTIFKGLPKGLALKGGKYRLGFGKLNPAHPHTYPFIEPPRVIAAMLPGEDGFNDVGAQASMFLPTPGSWASILSADVIGGSSFHPEETKSSPGWIARWSNSFLIGEDVPIEIGASAAGGTNSVQWETATNAYGADLKTKIPLSSQTRALIQAEYFHKNVESVADSASGRIATARSSGFYAVADLTFRQRYEAGIIYDRYGAPGNEELTDSALKCFAGFSLMEETTLFRLTYETYMPEGSHDVHTVAFQVLFSMGPHKAHQF
jgi:hypothetical protein